MNDAKHTLSVKSGYVLVNHPVGYEIDRRASRWRLTEVSALCKMAGCRKVLVVGPRFNSGLSTLDLFNLGERITELGLQVAVVPLRHASTADVRFLEAVTLNRGCPMRFFASEQEAKAWLEVE